MSESEVEKISEIVEDLEALKKAKERYQAKWPDFPLSGDPDPLGNPYWSENVEPLVNKILIDLVDLEDCISSHWPYSWPDWPPRNAIIDIIKEQRKPDNMDALIQGFKMVLRKVEVKSQPAERERKTASAKLWRIWTCIKGIPRWIYFLAALLTILYYLGLLEPVKALISKILGRK